MRVHIEIDDRLMQQAMSCSGVRTKKTAIEEGLRLSVQVHGQTAIRRLRGKARSGEIIRLIEGLIVADLRANFEQANYLDFTVLVYRFCGGSSSLWPANTSSGRLANNQKARVIGESSLPLAADFRFGPLFTLTFWRQSATEIDLLEIRILQVQPCR